MVAWAGIVTHANIEKESDAYLITFSLEHHYFDWIEDDSIQKAIFFLSPRGEGRFETYWSMPLSTDHVRSYEQSLYTTTALEYGRPGEPVRMLSTPMR